MARAICPWGYKYNVTRGKAVSRAVNRKHRCNVSCHERWTLTRCLQWAIETPIRYGPGAGEVKGQYEIWRRAVTRKGAAA